MVKGATITLPGETLRFGPDEKQDIPTGISWDTEMPGGFGPGQMTVPLPEGLAKDDRLLYADVRVYGPGNRTLAEGYITGVTRPTRDTATIQWAGHSTLLARTPFRAIIVDRDLARWGNPSRQRRLKLLSEALINSVVGPSVESDTSSGFPALTLQVTARALFPRVEGLYDAGAGLRVKFISYSFESLSPDGILVAMLAVGGNDAFTADSQYGPNLLTGTNPSGTGTFTPTSPQRFAAVNLLAFGTVGAKDQSITFQHLAVYGDHPVPLQGPAPQGVFAGDVVAYIISQSPLNGTLGDSIEKTTSIVPHVIWPDDVTQQTAIEDMTALGGNTLLRNDWGCYEDKEFFWRSPGTWGRVWHLRREQITDGPADGPDIDRRVAGVKVTYQDAAGETRSAGPPGSNADYETLELVDSDPDNPAHRLPGAYLTIDAGVLPADPVTQIPRAAINVGTVVLNDRNRLFWRGTMTTAGTVEDQHGNPYPAAMVRAGDHAVITDDPEPTEIPINSTSYQDDGEQINLHLGAQPDSEETMLAQLAAATDLIPG